MAEKTSDDLLTGTENQQNFVICPHRIGRINLQLLDTCPLFHGTHCAARWETRSPIDSGVESVNHSWHPSLFEKRDGPFSLFTTAAFYTAAVGMLGICPARRQRNCQQKPMCVQDLSFLDSRTTRIILFSRQFSRLDLVVFIAWRGVILS